MACIKQLVAGQQSALRDMVFCHIGVGGRALFIRFHGTVTVRYDRKRGGRWRTRVARIHHLSVTFWQAAGITCGVGMAAAANHLHLFSMFYVFTSSLYIFVTTLRSFLFIFSHRILRCVLAVVALPSTLSI